MISMDAFEGCLTVSLDLPFTDHRSTERVIYLGNKTLTNPDEIENAFRLGEYIKKGESQVPLLQYRSLTRSPSETLALYSLRKYRHLKRAYPPTSLDIGM